VLLTASGLCDPSSRLSSAWYCAGCGLDTGCHELTDDHGSLAMATGLRSL